MEVSTTNPAPPTGVTPTEVPLGITSTTTTSGGPLNKGMNKTAMFNLEEGLYYGQFTVNKTDALGQSVFEWVSWSPLGPTANEYNTVNDGNNSRFFVPWELMTAFYSKQVKIDWEIVFTAVKVSDCRVSFDVIFLYEDKNVALLYPQILNNDSYHKIFDDQDDSFSVVPPLYWMTNNVNTDSWRVQLVPGGAFSRMQPAFLPYTKMQVRIRSPYIPNSMQPDSFQVVVTLKPIVRQALGIAGKSVNATLNLTNEAQIPRPYFLTRELD